MIIWDEVWERVEGALNVMEAAGDGKTPTWEAQQEMIQRIVEDHLLGQRALEGEAKGLLRQAVEATAGTEKRGARWFVREAHGDEWKTWLGRARRVLEMEPEGCET